MTEPTTQELIERLRVHKDLSLCHEAADALEAQDREAERIGRQIISDSDAFVAMREQRDTLRAELVAIRHHGSAMEAWLAAQPIHPPNSLESGGIKTWGCSTAPKRPINCGTGHCSCIECVVEPAPSTAGEREALPMNTAPTDGTMVRLLVDFEGNSLEDTDQPVWTVGACYASDSEGDVWQFAGWNWSHDCFTEGHGKPIGWLPMLDAALLQSTALPAERKYISPVHTVADLINNLMLMDQTLPIYGAQWIDHAGKRRCIAVSPTVSRERIKDSRWIGEGTELNAAVIWTRAEQPALPVGELTDEQCRDIWHKCCAEWLGAGNNPYLSYARAILAAASTQPVREPLTENERIKELLHKHKSSALPDGACITCEGEGEIGGQFSGGIQECPDCSGSGKAAHGITKKGEAKEQTP